MPAKRKRWAVAFMPWSPLMAEVTMGKFTAWPFYSATPARIPAGPLLEQVRGILDCYVDGSRRPARKAAVISLHEGNGLFSPRAVPWDALGAAAAALAFASVDGSDQHLSHHSCTADNFKVNLCTFTPGTRATRMTCGAILRRTIFAADPQQVAALDHVNLEAHAHFDPEMLDALSVCLLKEAEEPAASRIVRSLRVWQSAYVNTEEVDSTTRILLMAVAFEILLQLGNHPRKDFRAKIHDLCRGPREPRRPYGIVNTRTGSLICQELLTYKQIWAEEFYKLRDRIVHGNPMSAESFKHGSQHHFWLAFLFYRVCVRKMLGQVRGCSYPCYAGVKRKDKSFAFDKGERRRTYEIVRRVMAHHGIAKGGLGRATSEAT